MRGIERGERKVAVQGESGIENWFSRMAISRLVRKLADRQLFVNRSGRVVFD